MQNHLQHLKKLLALNAEEEQNKKEYNLLKEVSMQLDEPVWECQTNSIFAIHLLKHNGFMRSEEITTNLHTQTHSN